MARVLLVGPRIERMILGLQGYEGIEVVFARDVQSACEAEGEFDLCIADAMETGDCTSECPGLDFIFGQQKTKRFANVIIVSRIGAPSLLAVRFPWIKECFLVLEPYSDHFVEAVVCQLFGIVPQRTVEDIDPYGVPHEKNRTSFFRPPWS